MNDLKDISDDYKQERRNIRTINLIIVTGRCYKYKSNYYEYIENVSSKSTSTRKWYECVLYRSVLDNLKFVRPEKEFYEKFEHVKEQLK